MPLFWRHGHSNAFEHKMLRSPGHYISVSPATFILPFNGKFSVCVSARSRPVYGRMLYPHFDVLPPAKASLQHRTLYHILWLIPSPLGWRALRFWVKHPDGCRCWGRSGLGWGRRTEEISWRHLLSPAIAGLPLLKSLYSCDIIITQPLEPAFSTG